MGLAVIESLLSRCRKWVCLDWTILSNGLFYYHPLPIGKPNPDAIPLCRARAHLVIFQDLRLGLYCGAADRAVMLGHDYDLA